MPGSTLPITNLDRGIGLPSYSSSPITQWEIVKGMASRFMYSQFYKALYFCMAILSFITLLLSLQSGCPSFGFIMLEVFINFAMMVEVGIRVVAKGKRYWNSLANIFDVFIVILCAITILLIPTSCSYEKTTEAMADTIILFIRNVAQFVRLFTVLGKNRQKLSERNSDVDFSRVPHHGIDDLSQSTIFVDVSDENDLFK